MFHELGKNLFDIVYSLFPHHKKVMTDLDPTQPALNGGEDLIVDDGEEAESKV
jgi:hypothetical protein